MQEKAVRAMEKELETLKQDMFKHSQVGNPIP